MWSGRCDHITLCEQSFFFNRITCLDIDGILIPGVNIALESLNFNTTTKSFVQRGNPTSSNIETLCKYALLEGRRRPNVFKRVWCFYPTAHSLLCFCSNSDNSRSAELNIVIQIKAAILKVPFTLVLRHRIWVNNSYRVSFYCTGGPLCSITYILSHKIPKESSQPEPSHSYF